MKYLKMLGLAAVAAAALTAFLGAGTASAETIVCKTTVTPCPAGWDLTVGDTVDASLTGTATLKTSGGTVLDTCTSGTVKGTVTTTTTPTATVEAKNLTWGGCTRTTNTTAGGSVQVHWTANHEGTVTVSGFSVTVLTVFGTCNFGFPAGEYTNLGNVTEGGAGTGPGQGAVLHVNTTVPKISGACPATANWEATFEFTEPQHLTIMKG